MADLNLKLIWDASTTTVANIFIDKYMPAANPTYSVVYLLLLRHASAKINISPEEAAEKLGLLESDVLKALKYWDKEGLVCLCDESGEGYSVSFVSPSDIQVNNVEYVQPLEDNRANEAKNNETKNNENKNNENMNNENKLCEDKPGKKKAVTKLEVQPDIKSVSKTATAEKINSGKAKHKLTVVASKPQYTVEELEVYKSDCAEIARLFKTAESALAKLLSFNDLSVIFSLYDWLRLPVEVIELLLNYCADNGHRSLRYIEKAAIDWAENGIVTLEKARAYIEVFKRDYSEILKAFGIVRREASQTEVAYMKKWINEYKMPIEVVVAACDKTIMAIGQPKFAYTDSIIENWNNNEVRTLEAVNDAQDRYYKEKLEASGQAAGGRKPAKQQAPRTNRFINFKQREWDYEQIERLEREYIESSLAQPAVSKA